MEILSMHQEEDEQKQTKETKIRKAEAFDSGAIISI
jgi:hypothetical protein